LNEAIKQTGAIIAQRREELDKIRRTAAAIHEIWGDKEPDIQGQITNAPTAADSVNPYFSLSPQDFPNQPELIESLSTLQREDVTRVLQLTEQKIREGTAVHIGVAAQITGASQNQIRDWERRLGLEIPEFRHLSADTKRLFTLPELLVYGRIRRLIDFRIHPADTIKCETVLWNKQKAQNAQRRHT